MRWSLELQTLKTAPQCPPINIYIDPRFTKVQKASFLYFYIAFALNNLDPLSRTSITVIRTTSKKASPLRVDHGNASLYSPPLPWNATAADNSIEKSFQKNLHQQITSLHSTTFPCDPSTVRIEFMLPCGESHSRGYVKIAHPFLCTKSQTLSYVLYKFTD
jgi:hypothetical protein